MTENMKGIAFAFILSIGASSVASYFALSSSIQKLEEWATRQEEDLDANHELVDYIYKSVTTLQVDIAIIRNTQEHLEEVSDDYKNSNK